MTGAWGSAGIALLQFLAKFHRSEDQEKRPSEDESQADERRHQSADGQDGEDDSRDESDAHRFGGFSPNEILRVVFEVFDILSPVAARSGFSNRFLWHLHGKVMVFYDESGKADGFNCPRFASPVTGEARLY